MGHVSALMLGQASWSWSSPSSNREPGFVLAVDSAQRISSWAASEQYPSKFKTLNKEL